MDNRRSVLLRFAAPLLVVVLWGSLPVANKLGVTHYSPLVFATLRALVASMLMAILLAIMYRSRMRQFFARFSRRDFMYLALVGFLQTSVFFYVISVGVSLVSASVAAILINTQPIFTVLLAHRVLGEDLTGRTIAGMVCAFLSIPLVALGGFKSFSASLSGYLLLLTGAICWAAAILLYKKKLAHRGEPLIATAAQLWVGTAALLLVALVTASDGWRIPDASTAYSIAYTAVLGTCIPYFLWFLLLGMFPASYLSVFTFLMPVTGIVLGDLILGERLMIGQLLGAAGVVLGVALIVIGGVRHSPQPTAKSRLIPAKEV
jgi:drug/metabolite transporter (DMT)-like permease